MDLDMTDWTVHSASDPIWIDEVWLDTVVVVGLTCFILCLMGLSKVSQQGTPDYYNPLSLFANVVSTLFCLRYLRPKWE